MKALIFAAGLGERMRPLTDHTPKPLLVAGGKPLIAWHLERMAAAGVREVVINTSWLADQFPQVLGDGSRWGVEIRYIEEESPLGTGGALGLLPDVCDVPVILMNGDVLTQLDVVALLEFHCARGAELTLCVREYDMQVPYGVVESDGEHVTGITEKPVHRFFVNAGIYVLSPQTVARTRPAKRLDVPDLIQTLLDEGHKPAMFPVHEYWIDIGRPDDFEVAQRGLSD